MEDPVFAFGPNDTFLCASPDGTRFTNDLPVGLAQTLSQPQNSFKHVARVRNAAVGIGGSCWYIWWENENSNGFQETGSGVPARLKEFLNECDRDNRKWPRVVFGDAPGSFFAWNHESVAWDKLPPKMEAELQRWTSRVGWRHGWPRTVALGAHRSYFMVTEQSYAASKIPKTLRQTTSIIAKRSKSGWGTLQYVMLDAFRADNYIIYGADGQWDRNTTSNHKISVSSILAPLAQYWESEARRRWEKKQEDKRNTAEEKRKKVEEEEEKRKFDEEATKDAAEKERREAAARRDRILAEMPQQLERWLKRWDDAVAIGAITTFPHPPTFVTACREVGWVMSQEDPGSIRVCRHDMRLLLKGSTEYSATWLKKKRVKFHPDRFMQRCHEDYRKELKHQAQQIFQIFGQLIDEENSEYDGYRHDD